jgi:hypothetical protein
VARALVALEGSVRFGLSDKTFEAWWDITPAEDTEDFVHIRGGNKLGARFVCALDYLNAVLERPTIAVLVRAYVLARKLEESCADDPATRIEAQNLYADEAVEELLGRIRFRSKQRALDRLAEKTIQKLDEQLEVEEPRGDVLKAAVAVMALEQRDRVTDNARRDKAAYRRTMDTSRQHLRDSSQPPSLEEFRTSIAMAMELFGVETVRELVLAALPIDGVADTKALTIEAE